MAISPWSAGDLAPLWTEAVVTDAGAETLAGVQDSQCQIVFENLSSGQIKTGAGVVHVLQATPAIITYQPASADTALPGLFLTKLVVNFGTTQSPVPKSYQIGVWDITPF